MEYTVIQDILLPPTIIGPVCLKLFNPDSLLWKVIILTRYPAGNILRLCEIYSISKHISGLRDIVFEMGQIR